MIASHESNTPTLVAQRGAIQHTQRHATNNAQEQQALEEFRTARSWHTNDHLPEDIDRDDNSVFHTSNQVVWRHYSGPPEVHVPRYSRPSQTTGKHYRKPGRVTFIKANGMYTLKNKPPPRYNRGNNDRYPDRPRHRQGSQRQQSNYDNRRTSNYHRTQANSAFQTPTDLQGRWQAKVMSCTSSKGQPMEL